MHSFRLAQGFARAVDVFSSSMPSFPDDENDIAFEMLGYLGPHLSETMRADDGLRFHAMLYLAYLRASAHASWQDYSNGYIGNAELAFIVERGARESRLSMASCLGGRPYEFE